MFILVIAKVTSLTRSTNEATSTTEKSTSRETRSITGVQASEGDKRQFKTYFQIRQRMKIIALM